MFTQMRWRISVLFGIIILVSLLAMGLVTQNPASGAVSLRIVVIALIIAVAGALLVGLVVSAQVSRPLDRLTTKARSLSESQVSDWPVDNDVEEIANLASALRHTSERIDSQMMTLAEDHDLMAAVLTSMTDGVIVADERKMVRLVNEAGRGLIGSTPEQLIGRPLMEVVRDHELSQLYDKAIQQSSPESSLVRFGERRRQIQAVAVPVGADPPTGHGFLILRDITEQRQAETIRQEFVANVSHELRTPLTTLNALVETLEGGALEDREVAREFLDKMQVEVDNLTQLVEELFELSRIESNQESMRFEPHESRELLVAAASRLQAQAERAGLAIVVLATEELGPALVAREKIEQVLINLIHNSIKFTNPGGQIRLDAYESDSMIVFSVADDGVGIPLETIDRIFERFYKTDRSRSSDGAGLGLAITKHVVLAHGGRVWADSQVGKGSTFYFSVPMANS